MKEFIEKLNERLEEYKYTHLIKHNCEICKHCDEQSEECAYRDCNLCVWDKAKVIVNQLAEEYAANTPQKSAGGWIPVTERLPKVNQRCLIYYISRVGNGIDIDIFEEKEFLLYGIKNVKAWQPLPAPYRMEKSEKAEWKDKVMNHFTKIE